MKSVKAILLIDSEKPFSAVAGMPVCLVDVLGRSVLQRTLLAFSEAGFGETVIVAERETALSGAFREQSAGTQVVSAGPGLLWRAAEQKFEEMAEDATHVLLVRLNAYLELDWEKLLDHHRGQGNKVTRAFCEEGGQSTPLDVFLVSGSRRNDAAFLLRSGMQRSRAEGLDYTATPGAEYVNLLRHESDLRRLASDALHGQCKLRPAGTELKPGIWASADSRIDRRARLVAPVFIGSRARICPGAVITRGSSIERHAVVGNKTVVENGTILPFTNLGPGLDVSHSVVGERHIFHLQRNVCTPIQDPRLISQVSNSAGLRSLSSVAKLSLRIPGQIWRGVGGNIPQPAAESSVNYDEMFLPAKPQRVELPQVSPPLAVARRYGNQ